MPFCVAVALHRLTAQPRPHRSDLLCPLKRETASASGYPDCGLGLHGHQPRHQAQKHGGGGANKTPAGQDHDAHPSQGGQMDGLWVMLSHPAAGCRPPLCSWCARHRGHRLAPQSPSSRSSRYPDCIRLARGVGKRQATQLSGSSCRTAALPGEHRGILCCRILSGVGLRVTVNASGLSHESSLPEATDLAGSRLTLRGENRRASWPRDDPAAIPGDAEGDARHLIAFRDIRFS